MQCPAEDILLKFLFGELPEQECIDISCHAEACQKCQDAILSLEQAPDPVFDLVRSLANDEPSTGDDEIDFLEFRQRLIELGPQDVEGSDTTGNSDATVRVRSGGSLHLPKQFGRYELQELIGRGGMGAVYRAQHLNLERSVAIKILPDGLLRSPDAIARFKREMRAVGALSHPNIVHATDADEFQNTHFIVMELVDGIDLSALVESVDKLSIADSCEMIRQAALGLQHAHDQGLVHRDIKPSNLLLSKEGVVKLLDLGLARFHSETDNSADLTSTSKIMGTIDYMAPEQADNSHAVDTRADIYSLGATLFRLLTGITPLETHGCNTNIQKLAALLHAEQPDAATLRSDLPIELVTLLQRLLSRSPDDRPQSASEVAQSLSQFCEGHSLSNLVLNARDFVVAPDTATNDPLSPTVVKRDVAERPLDAKQTDLPSSSQAQQKKVPDSKVSRESEATAFDSGRGIRKWLALAVLLGASIALGVVIRIATNKGDIVVEIADGISEQVTVNILRDGEQEIAGWTVSSKGGSRRIRTGRISVEIDSKLNDELETSFKGEKAELTRNGKIVVTITRRHQPRPEPVVTSEVADLLRLPGKTENILNGILPAPATLPGIGRWQIETVAPRGQITNLAYSPDGRWFACASLDGVVRIYRVTEDGISFHTALPDGRHNLHIRWHPGNQLLAVIGREVSKKSDSHISVWRINDAVVQHTFTTDCRLSSVDWSPDGNYLLATSDRVSRVFCWELSGAVKWERFDLRGGTQLARWNPTSRIIALANGKVVRLLDVESGNLIKEFPAQETNIGGMEWSPTGRYLATGELNWLHIKPTLRVWSADGVELAKVGVSGYNVDLVAWSRDEKFLAAGANMVRVWHFESDESSGTAKLTDIQVPQPFPLIPHRSICGLAWSANGELASADHFDGPRFWSHDPHDSKLAFVNYGQLGTLEWSPTDDRFVTYNNRGTIREWTRDGQLRQSIQLGDHPLPANGRSDMAWSPDGELLAVSHGDDKTTSLYRANTSFQDSPAVVSVPSGVAARLSWSPDSQLLAIAPWVHSEPATVWTWSRHLNEVRSVATENDSRMSWIGWNAKDNNLIKVMHNGRVSSFDSNTEISTPLFTPEPDDWQSGVIGVAAPSEMNRIALGCRWKFSACLDLTNDGKEIWRREDIETPLDWHPTSSLLAARDRSGMLRILNGETGETQHLLGVNQVTKAFWSSDGSFLASFPESGDPKLLRTPVNLIHLWETEGTPSSQPNFVGVMLPDGLAASFTPGGAPISLTPEAAKFLRWVVEKSDGSLEYLSREEFEIRVQTPVSADSESASPVPVSFVDPLPSVHGSKFD